MTDSRYPDAIDSDVELPRVDDNITEIGGDAINGLRSAVFAIEEALGVNPQGTAIDLATRLEQSLNEDGTIKAAALTAVGLVTLPITNSQIASNAAIEESKLDLNYNTVQLKTWIDELEVLIRSINDKVIVDIYHLSQHIAHPSNYGRHQTRDVDGYIGTYAAKNLQGIITDLDTRIIDHVTSLVDAHDASAISVDDTGLSFTADNVQTAVEELAVLEGRATTLHRDRQHGNGIVKAQKVTEAGSNLNVEIVAANSIDTFGAGATSVRYLVTPTGFSEILRNDIVIIDTGTNTYSFRIDKIDTSNDIIYFLGSIPVGSVGATAAAYRAPDDENFASVLRPTIRQASVAAVGGSVIQLVHPNAAVLDGYATSDLRLLSGTKRYIKLKWHDDETPDIDVYTLMQVLPLSGYAPSTWTVENLALALNELFKADTAPGGYTGSGFPYHFPFTAFADKGKIKFALDEPIQDGYLMAVAPSASSAWGVLGFVTDDVGVTVSDRRAYIDGYELSTMRKIIETTGQTESGFAGVKNIAQDLTALGISNSGLVRIKNSLDDGTYVFNAVTSTTLSIAEHTGFSTDSDVIIEIYADYVTVSTPPTRRTLYELFVDAYENTSMAFRKVERVTYDRASGSPNNPESWFDIVAVSRTFALAQKRITYKDVSGTKTVRLGDRGTGITITNPGPSVSLPSTNEEGFRFKLYDYNQIDYVELEIVSDLTSVLDNAIDVETYSRIGDEHALLIGTVLHDKSNFKHLTDSRILGTTGRKNVGEDYTRDYVSYPTSRLRGNGIIYGFEVGNNVTSIDAYGGEILVDGMIYAVSRTSFAIPTDGVTSTYNLFVDNMGVLNFLKDDQYVSGQVSTPSTDEIINSSDKTIIAKIYVNSSNNIILVRDLRRFVGKLDDKIELIVEEDNVFGTFFASLSAAINYINASTTHHVSKTIRISGAITHDVSTNALTLPANTTLIGDGGTSADANASKITLIGVGTNFMLVGNNCTIKNLVIEVASGSNITTVIGELSNNISNFRLQNCYFTGINTSGASVECLGGFDLTNIIIENCTFSFSSTAAINTGVKAYNDMSHVIIRDCSFIMAATSQKNEGIKAAGYMDNVLFENNYLDFPTNTSFNQAVAVTNAISNSIFTKCTYNGASATGKNYLLANGSVSDILISDCILTNCNLIVYGTTASNIIVKNNTLTLASAITPTLAILSFDQLSNSIISNNIFDLVSSSQAVIDIFGNSYGVVIDKNIVTFSASSAHAVTLTSDSLLDIVISENIFRSNSNSVAANQVIRFTGIDIGKANIINNLFYNYFNTCGFLQAIYIVPTSANNIMISNNNFRYFEAVSGGSIILNNVIYFNICDNIFSNCNNVIFLDTCSKGIISDNNYSIFANYAISLDTVHTTVISNNMFWAPLTGGSELMLVSNSASSYLNIVNNIFSASGTPGYMLISNGAPYSNIINNIFYGITFTAQSPLTSTGNYCMVINNNLQNALISGPSNTCAISGTGSIDYMNKGQIYTMVIDITNSCFQSDWGYDFTIGKKANLYSTTDTGNDDLYISFTAAAIPVGAKITQIDVHVSGASYNTRARWYRQPAIYSSSATAISGSISQTADPDILVLSPTEAGENPQYVQDDMVYTIFIDLSTSGACTVHGVLITYTL